MFQIVKNLKLLKKNLRILNTNHFNTIEDEAKEDRMALQQVQQLLQVNPMDSELQLREKALYQKLRNSSYLAEIGPILNVEQQVDLLKPFARKDVKEAIFQIDCNKSPGPDGYRSGFFKASWPVIGQDISEVVLDFFQNGKLLRQINSTIIALIPKVDALEYANQFRPISCCNVIYKCISKLIYSRLKHVITHIVADNQSTFIQGISMMHNVLICHDILRHYNRRTTPRCLMKINLRKAYDMVNWEFLEEVLKGFGFPIKFIQLVMMYVTSPKSPVNVNGENHGYFEGKRGLRQGRPYISSIVCSGNGVSIQIAQMSDQGSISRVIKVLAHFSNASGLIANMEKSSIFLAGIDSHVKEQILEMSGFSEAFGGGIFILPQSIVKEVDKICREYLWRFTEGKMKISLVAWDKICLPKKVGGLNVKRCRNWNTASVGKLLWQLVKNEDSLWVKWVHEIYMKGKTNIWSHQAPQGSSWYWRKLNGMKEVMHAWYHQGKYILTEGGEYSITNSYIALLEPKSRLNTAELIWSRMVMPMHRFILWLANQQRLFTKDRLLKLQIQVEDMQCCLCDDQIPEISQHIFGECNWTTTFGEVQQNFEKNNGATMDKSEEGNDSGNLGECCVSYLKGQKLKDVRGSKCTNRD
ncbi:uncharacterized protein LOC142171895 [Nicotiana tabacum]|uniref:Uncharacterized protein LOC142171895 n=1 Tax=Nicotiana tabacum TaxID=4097 RepID=A0AC58T3B8_TOBAC